MKKSTLTVSLLVVILMVSVSFRIADPDPAYLQAFGYSSICVSGKGYPLKDRYDATQFDFRNGKFYVSKGGTIDLRVFLPKGKTYGDLINEYTSGHPKFKDVVEVQGYWKIYSNYDDVGNNLFTAWPANPSDMLHQNKPLWFLPSNTEGTFKEWNTSGVDFTDSENNLQRDVGNWLSKAKSGWQLYILHTIGFRRNCPEDKYWDSQRLVYIIPISFEMAPPIATCIVEVK